MRLRRQFGEEDPVHTGQGERWRTEHGLPASDADGSATGYSDAIVKYRMTGCAQPGSARQVTLQPVFFRTGPADPSPTGATWAGRFAAAVPIWRKLGVTLTAASPVTLDDAVNKTAGSDTAERHRVRDQLMGPDIEVFLVDNDVATMGGGATRFGGSANGGDFYPFEPRLQPLDQLEDLIGRIDQEDVLDAVFSRFCVGK